MKRILLFFFAIFLIAHQQTKAQRGEGVVAAIGAAGAIGIGRSARKADGRRCDRREISDRGPKAEDGPARR